jgi:trehalose 6-phosphate synthase
MPADSRGSSGVTPICYKEFFRYGIFGLAVAAVVAFGISPFTGGIVQQWSGSDVEARSKLVLLLSRGVEDQAWDRLSDLFKRVALDQKSLAVGFCDPEGSLLASGFLAWPRRPLMA